MDFLKTPCVILCMAIMQHWGNIPLQQPIIFYPTAPGCIKIIFTGCSFIRKKVRHAGEQILKNFIDAYPSYNSSGYDLNLPQMRIRKKSCYCWHRVMEIIPAIDIIDGKCVRLTQGDYEQKKIYNEHPLEVAKQFEDAGLTAFASG